MTKRSSYSSSLFRGLLFHLLAGWICAACVTVHAQPLTPKIVPISASITHAVAASKAVEALVLLSDDDEKTVESASVAGTAAGRPLHLLGMGEYAQRIAVRQSLLSTMKLGVRSAVEASDLEVLTDYTVLPILHVRIHSPAALNRLAAHSKVLSVDEIKVAKKMLAESLPLISQPQAAAAGQVGSGTTVAVLDTGVDYTRAAFGSCSAPGGSCKVNYAQDFTPTSDGSLDDDGHGTNVAGAVLGVAPGARIAALDVFRTDGLAYSPDLTAAINWTIANKAVYNIASINMSLGGSRLFAPIAPTDAFGVTLQQAVAAGITVVAASGNEAYTDSIAWPAAYSNVVSVGAFYDSNMGGGVHLGELLRPDDGRLPNHLLLKQRIVPDDHGAWLPNSGSRHRHVGYIAGDSARRWRRRRPAGRVSRRHRWGAHQPPEAWPVADRPPKQHQQAPAGLDRVAGQ